MNTVAWEGKMINAVQLRVVTQKGGCPVAANEEASTSSSRRPSSTRWGYFRLPTGGPHV